LRSLLDRHPGLEREDPGMILLAAAAQPEAGSVPREVVDLLVEAGSALDDPLSIAACFDKPTVGWLRGWFGRNGRLRPEALSERPNLSDVGWPGRAVRDDPADVLAEGLAFAAHLGRAAACELLLDHGADARDERLLRLLGGKGAESAG
jgi:hypothetical protein